MTGLHLSQKSLCSTLPIVARGRRAKLLRHGKHRRSVKEWATLRGLNDNTLRKRLARGWSAKRALSCPKRPYRRDDDPMFSGGFR